VQTFANLMTKVYLRSKIEIRTQLNFFKILKEAVDSK